MPKAPEPAISRAGDIVFELDRLEVTGDGVCELGGRWFGVRGRRFMRPALTVVEDGRAIRLLADLADKPWAAEDGEPWQAVFPCDLKRPALDEAELTVAPDITISLPASGERTSAKNSKAGTARGELQRPPARQRGGHSRDASRSSSQRSEPSKPPAEPSHAEELAVLTRELVRARDEHRRLQHQLERLESEKAQDATRMDELLAEVARLTRDVEAAQRRSDEAAAQADALQGERNHVAAERDSARRARSEVVRAREAAQLARDRALSERGEALTAHERAESELDAAITARDRAIAERDEALAVRERVAAERDEALAVRERAATERDAALTVRDEAVAERDSMSRTNERLHAELTDAISSRGAALVMRRATQEHDASQRYGGLFPRALGLLAVLAVAALVAVIVLKVL